MLSKHIVKERKGICIIFDRHPGIFGALECIPDFTPGGVNHFCLRHICSNLNTHFNSAQLKDICRQAGAEHQIYKFNSAMNEIKALKMEAFTYLMEIDREMNIFL